MHAGATYVHNLISMKDGSMQLSEEQRRNMMTLFGDVNVDLNDMTEPQIDEKMDRIIGTVEVEWKGRVESVAFPLPADHTCLQDTTKIEFMDEVDLSTNEQRMKQLITKVMLGFHATKITPTTKITRTIRDAGCLSRRLV